MISRRNALIGATIAATDLLFRRSSRALAGASQPATAVNFQIPPGTCDCHTHIFGDPVKYPFAAARTYTPEPASVQESLAVHRAIHVDRIVIVQPSVYGADNSCLLDSLKQMGGIGRGIAVVDDKTSEAAMDEMDRAGVRGLRINLETSGVADPAAARQKLQSVIDRIGKRKWHVQIYTRPSVIESIQEQVMASPVTIVFDHFGGAQAVPGMGQAGFEVLVKLVKSGKAYAKISGAYRGSTQGPDYPDMAPLARALVAANPQRILWGTDWPHPDTKPLAGHPATDITPLLQIDDGELFNQLPFWVPDEGTRKAILVENPAELYGY
jgi:predicted TIM-barrel fold metal-dependent hydrolase